MSEKRSTTGLKSDFFFAIASAFQAVHEQAHEAALGQGHCEVPPLKHEEPYFATDFTLLPVSVHVQINSKARSNRVDNVFQQDKIQQNLNDCEHPKANEKLWEFTYIVNNQKGAEIKARTGKISGNMNISGRTERNTEAFSQQIQR